MMVLFLPEVRQYFQELEAILFEKEYFSFEDSAVQHVRDIVLEIEKTLPTQTSKAAPPYFHRYGKKMQYAMFRKSKTTQWYAFFTKYHVKGEVIYVVRYISNNHVIAKYL